MWTQMSEERSLVYTSNAKALNFLTQCIAEKHQLLKELKVNGGTNASKWWSYLVKKFMTRDMTKRYAMIDEKMKGLDPANFEDGHKYFVELEISMISLPW